MTWGPGDFGRPQYVNWSKVRRRSWLVGSITVALALLGVLYKVIIRLVVPNWPW